MVINQKRYDNLWWIAILGLLLVQYFRPQDFIPSMHNAPLFMPAAGLVLLFILFANNFKFILKPVQTQLIIIYLTWFVFLTPFSSIPGLSVQGIKMFIPLLPFVLAVPLLVKDVSMLKRLVNTFIVIMVIIGIIGYLNHGSGRYQMFLFGNFLTDPNDYALYMNTMVPVAFFMFLYETHKFKKLLYAMATLLAIVSVIASYSRGGFLGLMGIFGIIFIFSPNKKLISAIAITGVIAFLLFTPKDYTSLVSTSLDTSQSTAQTRLTAWKISLDVFIDNPFGIGINNTNGVMWKYDTFHDNKEKLWGDVSHSFWLTALTEGGIIGFIIILLLIFINISNCITLGNLRSINNDIKFLKYFGRAYFGAMTGFLISGTFLTVNYYPHLWYMSGMIAAGYGLYLRIRFLIAQGAYNA